MEKLRTLIVDDEYLALNLLENFIAKVPYLELTGREKSPLQALELLQRQPVDLLFLDIQMPSLSGNNLLRSLPRTPTTIFTTAYSEYATEAFDLNAADYLLKPFSFERFLQAVHKARSVHTFRQQEPAPAQEEAQGPRFFSAKVDGRVQKIFYEEILFIEGLKEYVRIHTPDARYVILESLRNLEEKLPGQFLRVHKSFIVAKDKVSSMEGNQLLLGAHKIPISRSKREEVVQAIFY